MTEMPQFKASGDDMQTASQAAQPTPAQLVRI
jgi:hypothetical protein